MKIPTFEEAKQALIEKRGTPLDRFVAYWEPQNEDEKFRAMLKALVMYVEMEATTPCALPQHPFDPYDGYSDPMQPLRFFWNPSTERYEAKP